eukprot:gene3764-4022_t
MVGMAVNASIEDINRCQFFEWYPILERYSIKSTILDLNEEFISYLKEDGIILPESVHGYMNQDELSDDEDLVPTKTESTSSRRDFSDLEFRVKQIIGDYGGEVFIKLNWSAPRDAVWMNSGSLKCTNLHDIYLLLKSSDRVVFDLENMYDLVPDATVKTPDRRTLVIRKWANLQPSMEFRLFVKDHKLIGICQRECTTFFNHLLSSIDDLTDKIENFYDKEIQGKLPLSNYVIDIYIDKKERIWIIDVNPFGEPTSALLFEWHELLAIEELDVRIVESEGEKLSSALGMKRGPVDVHLAPDFHNFLDICKRQAQEEDSNSDSET